MSWWTSVDFAYVDSEDSSGDTAEFDVEQIRTEIEAIVSAQRLHSDVAKDVCALLVNGRADFKLNSYAVIELFSKLAIRFPEISFAVRGRGEDIRDIWFRVYSRGRNTSALGPPEGAGI